MLAVAGSVLFLSLPFSVQAAKPDPQPEAPRIAKTGLNDQEYAFSGVTVEKLGRGKAKELGIADKAQGVVVTSVAPDSGGGKAGLAPEDVITEINRSPIKSVQDFGKVSSSIRKGDKVLIVINRRGTALLLSMGIFELLNGEPSTHQRGKVKVIEFADFYCPHCHHFEETAVPLLVKEFGNRVEITMVGFPVIPNKLPTAFEMYEQAKMMGKGNEMKVVLFRTIHKDKVDGVLDRSIRSLLIKEVGLDPAAFEAGLESGKPSGAFEEGRRWGMRIKVSSTPSILLDGNIKVDGSNMTLENVITTIRSILDNDAKK